ncbi:MAG: hypothetical protein M1834_000636 [Cirrosporium novae-zelandiae]|nr:MAG: hypothetical protein M1834_000636 [Cirrosporium novae-zelandiae]
MAEEDEMNNPEANREGTPSSTDASASEDDEPVETLVAGRTKRSTAGNRLSILLDKEADDELAQIFAEDEDDKEYTSAEDEVAGDIELDSSSSDDDDHGPTAGDDELEGEKEILRQARLERKAQKRKAKDPFSNIAQIRKKVKIDTPESSQAATPAPRPKKKSERFSFIPTIDDQPTRSSTRKQTMHNKEVTLERLKKGEETRKKVIEKMEAAEKRKIKERLPPLTQADRLAEAAKTERTNTKSLNRWEEAEKRRTEEQAAKLEALRNRQLEGPVVSWWSGMAKWVNGKLVQVGPHKVEEDDKHIKGSRRKGSSKRNKNESAEAGGDDSIVVQPHILPRNHEKSSTPDPKQITFVTPQGPAEFSQNLQHQPTTVPVNAQITPVLSQPPTQQTPNPPPSTSGNGVQSPQPQPPNGVHPPQLIPQNGDNNPSSIITISNPPPLPPPSSSPNQTNPPTNPIPIPIPLPAPTPTPLISEVSTRNLIILKNFSSDLLSDNKENTYHHHSLLHHDNNKKRTNKLPKPPQELCVITSQPARFRDPTTGLPYLNGYAYQEIQRLLRGGSRWSKALGCFVGPMNVAARGVPARFYYTPPPSSPSTKVCSGAAADKVATTTVVIDEK